MAEEGGELGTGVRTTTVRAEGRKAEKKFHFQDD